MSFSARKAKKTDCCFGCSYAFDCFASRSGWLASELHNSSKSTAAFFLCCLGRLLLETRGLLTQILTVRTVPGLDS